MVLEPHHLVPEGLSLGVEVVMVGVDGEDLPGVTLFRVATYLQLKALPRLLLPPVLTAYLQALVRVPLRSRFHLPPSRRQNPSIRPRVQPRKIIDPVWPSN